MTLTVPRLLLASPASGGGKTTVTIALLRALLERGLRPAAFKCGPDYIDPLFHGTALGVPAGNLDLFFTPPDTVRGLLAAGAAGAGVAVLEGAMGYYDGVGGGTEASAWDMARATATPTVLILNARGAFLSLAALAKGFRDFRSESAIAALLLNKCGRGLYGKLRPVLERETSLPVVGFMPDTPEAALASRHLGLAAPDGTLAGKIELLAGRLEEGVDIAALLAIASAAPALEAELPPVTPVAAGPVRVAVARDGAFCFHYRENLDLLRALGAELVFFSPLADKCLPAGAAGLILPGGYPELHAGELAGNASLKNEIRSRVTAGLPTLAEGGGFLYLQETLRDAAGTAHAMAGVLPGAGANSRASGRFGYVTLSSGAENLLLAAGESVRAHEFHYWDSDSPGDACAAVKADGAAWRCVVAGPSLFAGFPHLYFWSNPRAAARFVRAAAAFAATFVNGGG